MPLAVLVAAIISVPVMLMSPTGLTRLENLRRERAEAEREVTRLSREIRRLRAEVRRVKKEPAAVERVARDELGLVRQTEIVFQFDD